MGIKEDFVRHALEFFSWMNSNFIRMTWWRAFECKSRHIRRQTPQRSRQKAIDKNWCLLPSIAARPRQRYEINLSVFWRNDRPVSRFLTNKICLAFFSIVKGFFLLPYIRGLDNVSKKWSRHENIVVLSTIQSVLGHGLFCIFGIDIRKYTMIYGPRTKSPHRNFIAKFTIKDW
jgi:hypothetical protein